MSPLIRVFILTIIVGVSTTIHGSSFHKQKPLLTIKTETGQVYDCVDFYEQPTFKDPLLKNYMHEINQTHLQTLQKQGGDVSSFGFKDGGCPLGSVPILRSSDILKYPFNSTRNQEGHCTAVIRTSGLVGRQFFEASGSVSLYKAAIYGNQWTSSRIKVLNGPNSVEAGWMVNQAVFKNEEAHLYAMFKAGAKECLNHQCPGFVQVAKDVALGAIPTRYCHLGGNELLVWTISIEQHQDDRNWWLSHGPDKKPIGYWIRSLFTDLAVLASQVEWGGEIGNPEPSSTPLPFMGSGLTARNDTKLSSVYARIKVVENHLKIYPPKDIEKYENCQEYTTYDAGYVGPQLGHVIFYGGPHNV